MFNNIILEVSKDDVKNVHINNSILKKNKDLVYTVVDIENLNVNIKNKKIYILIKDEEVYIKSMTIPKVDKYKIDLIIKNKLIFLYGDKGKDILYTYVIQYERKKELKVLIFCINSQKISYLEEFINNNNIKKISLIQFCFLNYFEKYIDDKNYAFVFKYNNKIYFLGVINKKLVTNKIIDFTDIKYDFISELENIVTKVNNYENGIEGIYTVNINNDNIIKELKLNFDYKYINFGEVKNKDIIRKFIIKR